MDQPHCKYIDTAVGNLFDRNNVILVSELPQRMPTDRCEVYATWRRFPEGYRDHWQSTLNEKGKPTVAGYAGPSYSDFLPLDFDGPDLEKVLEQVRNFLQQLQVAFDIDETVGIRTYFSGAKGFHVLLDAELFGGWVPSPGLSAQQKKLACRLMSDQEGFDSTIYDTSRLFRLPNTQHGGSHLWKVPLSIDEVLYKCSIEDIKKLAAGPRDIVFPSWGDCSPASALAEIWRNIQKPIHPVKKETPGFAPDGFTLFPTHLKEGEGRDNAAFAIARYCRKRGWPETRTLELLHLWDSAQDEPLGGIVLEQKLHSTYRMVDVAVDSSALLTPSQLADAYGQHIEKLKGRRISLGLPNVDHRIRCIVPGEVCVLLARSGVGKTMLAQNIIRNVSRNNPQVISLFASLEQPSSMCFERYAQMALNETGSDIERTWGESETGREGIRRAVMDMLGENALTYVESTSLDKLGELVSLAQQIKGHPVDLLLIDYLGMIGLEGMGRTLYEQMSNLSRGLKGFAKAQDLSLILLCQVGRTSGEDGNMPLTKSSGRDTGAIEESADIELGLYRPWLNQVDTDGNDIDNILSVQILKNRKGREGETFDFALDRRSVIISGEGKLQISEFKPPKNNGRQLPEGRTENTGNLHIRASINERKDYD